MLSNKRNLRSNKTRRTRVTFSPGPFTNFEGDLQMKKTELFPVLIGYVSNLPPDTILDIKVLHRLLADKLGLNAKESTLKQYLTLLANAGFSVKKKRITRQKVVYFVVGEGNNWPFKLSFSEVKELSVKRGSANVELVASREDLGKPLIMSLYKKTEFDKPDSILEVKEEKDVPEWYDVDFEQLTNENLKEILVATRISEKSIGRILWQVLADTFSKFNEMIFALANYEKELSRIRKYKADLERQKLALEGERTNLENQVENMERTLSACESRIKDLEELNTQIGSNFLKEEEDTKKLEIEISQLQRDKEILEKKLRAALGKPQKFATIGEFMQAKESKGG